MDVHDFNLSAAAAQVPTEFPGVNMIRVDVDPLADPATYAAAVASLTAKGIVVEFSDYTNSLGTGGGAGQGVVFTGSLLANEQAWYAAMASYYKNNPYVWLGTNNEPATTGGSLSDWQKTTYDTIRAAGNNNPILLEPSGTRPPGYGGTPLQSGMNPADYANMTNVIWDPHVYSYQDNNSTDQATANAEVQAMITGAQSIQSANGVVPVIIGEYSPWATGGTQTVNAVISSGVGSTAWVWDSNGIVGGASGDPTGAIYNSLLSGGVMTTFGQQVAAFIAGNLTSGSATSATVGQSQVSGAATSGTSMLLLKGTGAAASPSSGEQTYVIPAAGNGVEAFTSNILAMGDTLNLTTALAATNWNHSPAALSNYLTVTDSAQGATLSISATSGGSGVAIATIHGATTATLSSLLAHSIT